MQKVKDNIALAFHGMTITQALEKGVCIDCRRSVANTFKDGLSVREYQISGLCQRCQDKVFGES